jgi:hypothetical protein
MKRLSLYVGVLLTIALLSVPASAMALAGGSTGGGGGGGGFSGGGGGGSSFGGSGSGSGSSCTGDDCAAGGWLVLIIFGAIVLFVSSTFLGSAWTNYRRGQRLARVEKEAEAAHVDDGYWEPQKLKARVRECFRPIQMSWENRNVEESRPYVSDALYERHKLQLDGFEKQGRVNRIKDLWLGNIEIVGLHNVTDDGEDRFVAHFKCSARDWMEDIATGKMINGSKDVSHFEQYWSFSRHPEYGWVLDEIQQATEGKYHESRPIVNKDEGPATYGQPGPSTA